MKLNKMKKLLSFVMAASMVANLGTVAFAAEVGGGTDGLGETEFVYNPNIFQVSLPVVPDEDNTLDFILDPMGVIEETGSKKLGAEVTGQSLYFANVSADGKTVTYSNISDAYQIINKSTFGVDITVEVNVSNADDLTFVEDTGEAMTTDAEYKESLEGESALDAEAQVYLAVQTDKNDGVDDEGEALPKSAVVADGTATLDITLNAHSNIANIYGVKYNTTTGVYKYDVKDTLPDGTTWADTTANITLTGACNDIIDAWSTLGDIEPKVEITWTVTETEGTAEGFENRNDIPVITDISLTKGSSTEQVLTITLPENYYFNGISGISYVLNGKTVKLTVKTHYLYDFEEDATKLTLTSAHIKTLTAAAGTATFTVTFNDGTTTTFKATITG